MHIFAGCMTSIEKRNLVLVILRLEEKRKAVFIPCTTYLSRLNFSKSIFFSVLQGHLARYAKVSCYDWYRKSYCING